MQTLRTLTGMKIVGALRESADVAPIEVDRSHLIDVTILNEGVALVTVEGQLVYVDEAGGLHLSSDCF